VQQGYEELAVELGNNHAKRHNLSQRLKNVRMSCPLFDTTQWIRDLEKVYFRMWDIHCQGKGPRTFEVR
jgi:protein O-GlcNAc transferase